MRRIRRLLWAVVLPALMLGMPHLAVGQTSAPALYASGPAQSAPLALTRCPGSRLFISRRSVRHRLLNQVASVKAIPHQPTRHAALETRFTRFAPVLTAAALFSGSSDILPHPSLYRPLGRAPPLV